MSARTLTHIRFHANYLFPVDDEAVRLQNSLPVIFPTPGSTLIRTRLFIQFRILNYPDTGDVVLDTQWWQDVCPYYGILVTDTPVNPIPVDDPLGGEQSDEWVIWGMGIGKWDGTGPDQDFPTIQYVTYSWEPPGGISESFAKRKTTVGFIPAMYLSWNWSDRHNFINQAHGSFPIAYDMAVQIGLDTIWELPPE